MQKSESRTDFEARAAVQIGTHDECVEKAECGGEKTEEKDEDGVVRIVGVVVEAREKEEPEEPEAKEGVAEGPCVVG